MSAITGTFDFLRSYAVQLSSYRDHCDSILKEVESALNHLQDLQHKHLLVSTKTGALHEACEQLLQDQVREIVYLTLDIGVNSPTGYHTFFDVSNNFNGNGDHESWKKCAYDYCSLHIYKFWYAYWSVSNKWLITYHSMIKFLYIMTTKTKMMTIMLLQKTQCLNSSH